MTTRADFVSEEEAILELVTIDLPDIYIRSEEYPLFLHISGAIPIECDVQDALTPPLVVSDGDKQQHYNFDVPQNCGHFSVPSRLIANEIRCN